MPADGGVPPAPAPAGGGVPPGELRFGVLFNGDPRRAARLERHGVDSLWVGGHVAGASATGEALTALARMSAATERVQLGTAVLLLPLYPPAIVAKAVADLDRVTGGRVVLGVGVGGESPQEFRACQVPPQTRGQRTDEAIGLLRRLWTARPVTHEGRFYPMSDVRVHPPWLPYLYSPRRYAASVAAITAEAAAAGRDLSRFGWYAMIFVNVDLDGDAARAEAARWLRQTYGQDFPVGGDRVAAGTPPEVAGQLLGYADAGVRHFVCCVAAGRDSATAAPPEGEAVTSLLAEQVLPAVRAAWRHRGPGTASRNSVNVDVDRPAGIS